MKQFRLIDGVLIITNAEPVSGSVASHLRETFIYDEDCIHVNETYYDTNTQAFFAEHHEANITKVKFEHWERGDQALFLGFILQDHPNIEEIDLSHCRLRDTDIPFLLVLFNSCHHLKKIKLDDNFISNEGALLLLHTLLEHSTITEINLSKNDIGYQTSLFMQQQIREFTSITMDITENQQPDDITAAKQITRAEAEISHQKAFLGALADEFQPGDLLYGLSHGLPSDKGRNPVEEALKIVLAQQAHHQLLLINPFSDWVINKNNLHGASKKELIFFEDFFRSISPSLYPTDGQPFFEGWSEHKIICKLGLLWAKKNDRQVHYVLDDLRMEHFSSGHRNRADTSVTESELKFIARFYEDLKDNVQFWRTDKESGRLVKALPPWLDPETKHHWEAYMQAQASKMRHFPKTHSSKEAFFKAISERKQYSILTYRAALEALLEDIIAKTANPALIAFIGIYLAKLLEADTKYKLEKLVFELKEEYQAHESELKDNNLDSLLNHLVKKSGSYSTAAEHERFFFRRPIIEVKYGNKVLDMIALFTLADALVKSPDHGAVSPPKV
ncbi:hypothetical protein [Legionella oakridgensis]|uniref:hypothetical protein n=1 Tax=Legionella oakridgensis TaxID=29423 RepID=UPI0003DE3456|nr:hypothetical protein [Legionella oakridgensis]ETO93813.1 hypothetical protein LOR_82c23320 [Legionella oakridgensis RV-2-2007]